MSNYEDRLKLLEASVKAVFDGTGASLKDFREELTQTMDLVMRALHAMDARLSKLESDMPMKKGADHADV